MTEPILVETRLFGIILLILVSLGGLLLSRQLFLTWCNPLSIYVAVWGGVLTTCLLPWLGYDNLSAATWLCFVLAAAGYFLGIYTVTSPYLHPVFKAFRVAYDHRQYYSSRLLTVLQIMIVIKTVYLGMKVIQILEKFGSITVIFSGSIYRLLLLEQTGALPETDMASKTLFGSLFGFIDSLLLIAVVWGAYFVLKKRYIGFLPLILETMHSLLGLERFRFLVALSVFLSSLYLHSMHEKGQRQPRQSKMGGKRALLSGIGVLTLLAMLVPLQLRHPEYTITQLLSHTGSYFITPILAFNQYIARVTLFPEPLGWGTSTFWGIAAWLKRFQLIDQLPPFHYQYVQIAFGDDVILTNVYTYLINMLSDWGLLGVLLWPYIFGVICGVCYERVIRYRTLLLMPILCLLFTTLFLSFYTLIIKAIIYITYIIGSLILTAFVIAQPSPSRNRLS